MRCDYAQALSRSRSMIAVSIQIALLIVFVAGALLYIAAKLLKFTDAKTALSQYFDAFLIGVLAARLSYITLWWADYWQSPMAMFALADGGYIPYVGIIAGAVYLGFKNNHRQWRMVVISLAVLGSAAFYISEQYQKSMPQSNYAIAETRFDALQLGTGERQLIQQQGKITVVNLWATWCPPCRREMPQFQLAEQQLPQVNFIMLNQGENAETITAFLLKQGLSFEQVWLDTHSYAMDAMQAKALPTTLFINAKGELVYQHLGELSVARIKEVVRLMERE